MPCQLPIVPVESNIILEGGIRMRQMNLALTNESATEDLYGALRELLSLEGGLQIMITIPSGSKARSKREEKGKLMKGVDEKTSEGSIYRLIDAVSRGGFFFDTVYKSV